MSNTTENHRLYDVVMYHVDIKTGRKTNGYNHGRTMSGTPMPHNEAVTFRSNIDMGRKGISYELVEYNP